MPQLARVLIPLDGSQPSEHALGLATAIGFGETESTLLHVADPGQDTTRATRYLRGIAQKEAVPARVLVRQAHGPARQILDEAEQGEHDLVVLTTHRPTGVMRRLRGCVAERVLRRCSAPLLVWAPGAADSATARVRRVLVPLGEGEADEAILPLVKRLCGSVGAEVVLFTALPIDPDYHTLAYLEELDSARDEAEARLEGLAASLRRDGVEARIRVDVGCPREAILRAADELGVDLIALTNRGRSAVRRWLFGSVAEDVARAYSKPVLLVRQRVGGVARARPGSYAAG